MCGDLNRGEHMNCAVLAWDAALGDEAPVTTHLLKDWSRIDAAFFEGLTTDSRTSIHDNIIERLTAIKTYADFRRVVDKMGPYTPFEFTEDRGSIVSPRETAADMAAHFLRQKV